MTLQGPLVGIGYRHPIGDWIRANLDRFDVLEVTVEHFIYGNTQVRAMLEHLARRVPIAAHGVGLSLGTDAPVDESYLCEVSRVVRSLGAERYSEHLAFTKVPGLDLGNLIPLPRTPDVVEWVGEKIRRASAMLPVPLDLENISYLFDWPDSSMSDGQFIRAVCEAAGTGVLLDIENVYVNAHNHGFEANAALAEIPADLVSGMHIAGGASHDQVLIDSHDHAVPDGAIDLLDRALTRFRPDTVILERDDRIEAVDEILADVARIRACLSDGTRMEMAPPAPKRSRVRCPDTVHAPLFERQRALLAFLTTPRAAPDNPVLSGFDEDRLRLMRELSVGKRLEKVRACFPVTLDQLDGPSEALWTDFLVECPPYDIGHAENARQFHDFLVRRWERMPPRRDYVRDVARIELGTTLARRAIGDSAARSRSNPGTTIRCSGGVQFVQCSHDVRPLFEREAAVTVPVRRDVRLVIVPPAAGDADRMPRIQEFSADLYEALLSLGEERLLAGADPLGIGAPPIVVERLLDLGILETVA